MKRFFDLLLVVLIIIILLLPMIIIGLFVKLSSRGNILYWSYRVGVKNQTYKMPKFRSMSSNAPELATHLIRNPEDFLTPIGKFLRRNSLDELPQLFSILKGDMTFVGPRPALFNQYDLIELRKEKGVHELVPGVTGWAQINGRDKISIIEKVKLDEEYLIKKSFFFDLKILWLTFIKIISKEDITH
jgi:O-antigen biosynthesis protein WbqP